MEKLSLAFSCVDFGTFSIIASLAIRMNEMDRVLRDRIQEFDLRKVTNLMQSAKVWAFIRKKIVADAHPRSWL